MKAGYWQIELHPSPREKSAFVTHNGIYEFEREALGLVEGIKKFQPYLQQIFLL